VHAFGKSCCDTQQVMHYQPHDVHSHLSIFLQTPTLSLQTWTTLTIEMGEETEARGLGAVVVLVGVVLADQAGGL
jgi:hypothetical protein